MREKEAPGRCADGKVGSGKKNKFADQLMPDLKNADGWGFLIALISGVIQLTVFK
jgi:hypothetical protein